MLEFKRGVLSKTGEGISRFNKAADELVPVGFGFAPVTYGAGGSTREGTLAARELKKKVQRRRASCFMLRIRRGIDLRITKNLLK